MVELGFTHMTLSLDSLHHIAFYPVSLGLLGGSKKDKPQGLLLSSSLKSSGGKTANTDVFAKLEAWEPNVMHDSGLDAMFLKICKMPSRILREISIGIISDNIIVSS